MPAPRACPVRLTAAEGKRLNKIARGHKSPARDKLRAQLVLDAARDFSNAAIAGRRRVTVDTVRKWRGRFAAEGLHGLTDRKRSGRPPTFTPVQAAEVKALACQLPAEAGVPLARWNCPDLAREALSAGIAEALSASTVRRWLAADAIKTLAAPILDLPPGPGLPGQGQPGPGPLRRPLGRQTARRRRVRDLLR